ncbi:MAG: 1-acyl-sn-glycerol-3-phosphate acyltransferase [Bacteroidales bacterium]|nr:1-acyl-sn-glycerol-3-phosphate acyltransferase [Bacteroidales bacterium]MCF8328390.1 1-acyl-sn-glycerol-3-phosphate acyltransferase [Bacteroidales bacterium]
MTDKSIKHITRWSITYYIFYLYVKFMHWLFYRKIVVEGKENIPEDEPVIFAPNHQNAVMDPLAVIFTSGQQVVFLARADIFKSKILARIFSWLKILPVYRIRDGADTLKHNTSTFSSAIQVLEHKQPIGLFPEAAHSNKRHLLSFKKGVPRIAFQAEEENNFQLGVKILPIGIYYSRYNKFRSIIHIRYGKPIDVSDFIDEYKENPNKGMNSLRDAMKKATEPLVINITNLEFYDMYESLRTIYFKKVAKRLKFKELNQSNKFIADKMTVKQLDRFGEKEPEKLNKLRDKVKTLYQLTEKYSLSYQSIAKPKLNLFRLVWNSFLLILFFPVFLYGLINNFIPYIIPKILVLKFQDLQFHSSVKFIGGLVLFPLFYLIQTLIVNSFVENGYVSLLYLLSLPVSGLIAQFYHEWFALTRKDVLLYKLKKTDFKNFRKIKDLYNEIMGCMNKVLSA